MIIILFLTINSRTINAGMHCRHAVLFRSYSGRTSYVVITRSRKYFKIYT